MNQTIRYELPTEGLISSLTQLSLVKFSDEATHFVGSKLLHQFLRIEDNSVVIDMSLITEDFPLQFTAYTQYQSQGKSYQEPILIDLSEIMPYLLATLPPRFKTLKNDANHTIEVDPSQTDQDGLIRVKSEYAFDPSNDPFTMEIITSKEMNKIASITVIDEQSQKFFEILIREKDLDEGILRGSYAFQVLLADSLNSVAYNFTMQFKSQSTFDPNLLTNGDETKRDDRDQNIKMWVNFLMPNASFEITFSEPIAFKINQTDLSEIFQLSVRSVLDESMIAGVFIPLANFTNATSPPHFNNTSAANRPR
jgi:hypothetical protein